MRDDSLVAKDHPNSRIFTSFLYDFGKAMGGRLSQSHGNEPFNFFDRCFSALWSFLPNLQELHEKRIMGVIGQDKKLLRSFARAKAVTSFRKCLDKGAKSEDYRSLLK
jgi:hypothetical protein